jgi:hypothetical protein
MRLADLPRSVLHGAAEAPILLYRRNWCEVVHPGQITMLHARDKVVEVYTHDGYRGARAGATVVGLVTQYLQCDWVLLSRAVAVKRSAILRVEHRFSPGGYRTHAARVAGVADPVPISRRHWSAVRRQLGGGA